MKEKYIKFIADLGIIYEAIFGNVWWYSLVHEKNTTISKSYHHICKGVIDIKKFLFFKSIMSAIRKYFTFLYRYIYFWKGKYKLEKKKVIVSYLGILHELLDDDSSIVLMPQKKDYRELRGLNVIDNFIRWKDFVIIPFKYLFYSFIFLLQDNKALFHSTAKGYSNAFRYETHKEDFYRSFIGDVLIEGLFFESAFKHMVEENIIDRIAYVYEGRAWEKALCLSFPYTLKVGILCSIPCRNTLQMFYDKVDVWRMPQPDRLGVMGEFPKEIMSEVYGKDKVFVLGTTRYVHLKYVKPAADKNFIGVILYANDQMNKELLNWVFENYDSHVKDIRVVIHPDSKLKEIDLIYLTDDLRKVLAESFVVIVSSSSVALEANIYGAPVVLPTLKTFVNSIPSRVIIRQSISEREDYRINEEYRLWLLNNYFTFNDAERMREIIDKL